MKGELKMKKEHDKNTKRDKKMWIASLLLMLIIFIAIRFFSFSGEIKERVDALEYNQNEYLFDSELYSSGISEYYFIDDMMDPSIVDEESINYIAKTIYGEAEGLDTYEKSLVAWCILNRFDNGNFGDSIISVITAPNQFFGYKENNPITKENYGIAKDVCIRWAFEQFSVGNVGRTLPKEMLYFYGNGEHNYYRENININGEYWFYCDPYSR